MIGLAGCIGTGPGSDIDHADTEPDEELEEAIHEGLGSDGGCGEEAGNTFDEASEFCGEPKAPCTDGDDPYLCYPGAFAESEEDYYRIHLEEGDQLVVDIYSDASLTVHLMDPEGTIIADATGSETTQIATNAQRVTVPNAHMDGDYRLHVTQGPLGDADDYGVCVRPCEEPVGVLPQELIWGPISNPDDVKVLLIPPSHGDLSDPNGPTVQDYINETLQGIYEWEWALEQFAQDYPEYSYLKNITVQVDIFEGPEATPIDPAGYDVVIGYVASGPAFRGVAVNGPGDTQGLIENLGADDEARWEHRYIALSLYAASPRAGQAMEDFPERNDLHTVTLHEFGHTFGLGHTWTWTNDTGPDLMNSPATFVYGDGEPFGQGDQNLERQCLNSLNLYGMAIMYQSMDPSNDTDPEEFPEAVELPDHIPYELYCPNEPIDIGILGDLPMLLA